MKRKLIKFFDTLVILSILIGSPFLIWFYFIDGIYFSPILTFKDGVNPMQFKLEKTEYTKGDTILGITEVTKNRQAKCYVSWSLVNDIILPFSPTDIYELSPGDYHGLFKIIDIPTGPIIFKGEHYITGEQHCFLPGNRERVATFKTEPFYVK